ncbi:MAG: hypothetical protein A3F31_05240 [Candidatus Levybacteria bacterium RIFCSPHIGHO2_12_FULL_38_12]|nr:MAG: hypothetical protein A2770_03560 [Candidatus Levybacteria bacterium RIFCSPHIGHO2_01_FULL_38_12]OGH22175.1 MAG: hypothetical protein A3F31_05240 [Candidatus Levybacteria bacterium RIFCSPHIGHO2_12_FULL_38_12]OGH34514.1 MAG: hypothetical protein A3A47_01010 [Candidatus Levybacteria bacterium RIFCSPLOWO2_01_FULL_37_20]OGH44762.1 MAG: hypothetical protein A3J14_00370 [Candidatus Levybacteria bacterium RIFCSPLOWO2_02_FULL_37_18]
MTAEFSQPIDIRQTMVGKVPDDIIKRLNEKGLQLDYGNHIPSFLVLSEYFGGNPRFTLEFLHRGLKTITMTYTDYW